LYISKSISSNKLDFNQETLLYYNITMMEAKKVFYPSLTFAGKSVSPP
jgi:hypothetical protein